MNNKIIINKINALQKEKRKYKEKYNKEPSIEYLASILNTNKYKILELESVINNLDNNSYIEEIKPFNIKDLSKEEYNELINKIKENKHLLNKREQVIISLSFGLVDNKYYSNKEISIKYNITEERVRQIIAKSIRIVKNPERRKKLKDYLKSE